MLTNAHLCNLEDTSFKRSIYLSKIKALTKSTQLNNIDFIVHVEDEYDYMYRSKQVAEIVNAIKESYFTCMNQNLPIYAVPGKITVYMSTQKSMLDLRDIGVAKGQLPPDEFRMWDEDVTI